MPDLTPFRFSVVQFHRDPLRGEAVNVGLIAVDNQGKSFCRFEKKLRGLLRVTPTEMKAIASILEDIRGNGNFDSAFRLVNSYAGMIQLTELRGGLTSNIALDGDSLFETFVARGVRVRKANSLPKTALKDFRSSLKENSLLGPNKVRKDYTIDLDTSESIHLNFGYPVANGHVAIEVLDLTLPSRDKRLVEIGPVMGKFRFLHDRIPSKVNRIVAVRTNCVDAQWELESLKACSDSMFNLDTDRESLLNLMEKDLGRR